MLVPDFAPSPVRLRIDLAYDGSRFHGWAAQPGLRTVQGTLESALAQVTRTPVTVTVAGRTDTGVHARGQVVHLDLDVDALAAMPGRSDRPAPEALAARLAGVLPSDIVIRSVRHAPADFDARFSALRRRYRYRISDAPTRHDPMRHDVLRHRRGLDVEAMGRAAQALLGEHDFLSFCRLREGATTIRTLEELSIRRTPEGRRDEHLVVITVQADAFCHHMVRSLVGALMAVGEGRRGEDWPLQVLQARTRRAATRDGVGAAPMAPAIGLTLEHVEYPPDHLLGDQAERTRVRRDTWSPPHEDGPEESAHA